MSQIHWKIKSRRLELDLRVGARPFFYDPSFNVSASDDTPVLFSDNTIVHYPEDDFLAPITFTDDTKAHYSDGREVHYV